LADVLTNPPLFLLLLAALRYDACHAVARIKKNRMYFLLTVVIAYVSILYAGQVGIQALDKLH